MKPADELWGNPKNVGQPVDRVDGRAKVTGQAKYAAEFFAPDLHYGVIISAAIPKGKIKKMDLAKALAAPGVVDVITHENRPSIAWFNSKYADQDSPPGWHFRWLQDEHVSYANQPIALVIARTFEEARYASRLVQVDYEPEEFETDLKANRGEGHRPPKKANFEQPSSRGDFETAYATAPVKTDSHFHHETEHHNPMEMFASTVIPGEDGRFLIHDKTQGTVNSQTYLCNVFGLKKDKVQVKAEYVGGAFGSGLRPQYQLYLAMMAALHVKKAVRVVMTRQQMFSFGYRPSALQNVKLGAELDGTLTAMEHKVISPTSQFEEYVENIANWSGLLYQCKNMRMEHELVPLDVYTPLDMRAPGAATGLVALECAMDELAVKLRMDPVDLRLKNFADRDQNYYGRPFSSKNLKKCYVDGAQRFGWLKRNPEPGSMRNGKKLVGWGMATGIWEAIHMKSSAEVEVFDNGGIEVSSSVTDIGTGTYTILAQIAADVFGLELDRIRVRIGDSSLAEAPLQGGSWTASSSGAAVQDACLKAKEAILKLARKHPDGPFAKATLEDVKLKGGELEFNGARLSIEKILRSAGEKSVKVTGKTSPDMLKALPHARNTHSAIFAEVQIDEDFRMIEVTRIVSAVAAGKILNPKTARSQVMGGVVWGISQALHEESVFDHRLGRIMNHNFAEYHIAVNKDVGEIDVLFVEEDDTVASPIGVKGVGEIGIVGTAAAIANAVYHATGKRVREFPITLDKIL